MARVLFVGQQPETVDFTNPMLPPGMNAERIHAGITLALKQMAERGWHADLCLLRPDETAGPDVERRLKAQTYGFLPALRCRVLSVRAEASAWAARCEGR